MNVGDHVTPDRERSDAYADRWIKKGTRGIISSIDGPLAYVDWDISGKIIRGCWCLKYLLQVPALTLLAECAE